MNKCFIIVLVSVLMLGGKKPFSQQSETALALPNISIQESIVFIAGFDESDNTYYGNAKQYFQKQGMPIVEGLHTINEIIAYINKAGENQVIFKEIHVVSHSNAWLGMSMRIKENDERITLKSLEHAVKEYNIETICKEYTGNTKIIFHSCGLG